MPVPPVPERVEESVVTPLRARGRPQAQSIDLSALVRDALRESRTAYRGTAPLPRCEGVLPSLLLCLGDEEELSQMLESFFHLAFQNARGGLLTILARPFEEKVRLSIVADPPRPDERWEATLVAEFPLVSVQ